MRQTFAEIALGILLVSCGGNELSLPDYVEEMNEIVVDGRRQIEPLYEEYMRLETPGVEDVRALFEREVTIRLGIHERMVGLEPPAQVADLHEALVEWHVTAIAAERALSARAAEAAGWGVLEQSGEARTYDSVMTAGLTVCHELQAKLDDTARRSSFADTPWIPGDLRVVDAFLGCDTPISD